MTKLTQQQVDTIRWLRALGRSHAEISRCLGVSAEAVRQIARGERHGNVSPAN